MDTSAEIRSAGVSNWTTLLSVLVALSGVGAGVLALPVVTPVFGVLLQAADPWAYIYSFFVVILLVLSPLAMITAGLVGIRRPSRGGGVGVGAAIGWLWVMTLTYGLSLLTLAPAVVGFLAALVVLALGDHAQSKADPRLRKRQRLVTRLTHWTWAICLFFLLLSGLNIFNARPQLYIGQDSGFEYDNTIFQIGQQQVEGKWRGYVDLFGLKVDTTGVFGVSGPEARPQYRAFPSWSTIPSGYNLATARVVHFFFGWVFVAVIFIWFVFSFFNGHLKRDVVVTPKDLRGLPKDIVDHATFHFEHKTSYSPLQKVAYFGVFFVLFPLIIATGLTMSPGMDSMFSFLLDVFGGRQTARTIHFVVMVLLVLFFIVHIIMVFLAGPFNELRSMISGWYRISPASAGEAEGKANG